MRRKAKLARTVGVVAGISLIAGAAGAYGVPAPDRGPETGGTTVTVEVPDVAFQSISAGYGHTLAIGQDGRAYGWGHGINGQLGDGNTDNQSTPVEVSLPEAVSAVAVSAGGEHSLALGSDGSVYAWGLNLDGQLGDGSGIDQYLPVKVASPAGVSFVSISAGREHSLAIGDDGRIYAWGSNVSGELGDGTYTSRATPVEVAAPEGVTFTQVSAGVVFSLALTSDGRILAWGENSFGQLGTGSTAVENTPVEVVAPGGISFAVISAGLQHSVALADNGEAYTWGRNIFGQLGLGSYDDQHTPVAIPALSGIKISNLAAGYTSSVALGENGKAYAWGANTGGQLGDGSTDYQSSPVEVGVPTGITFTDISLGNSHVVALGDDGNAYSWGDNSFRQLGSGTYEEYRTLPAPVATSDVAVTGVAFGGVAGTTPGDIGGTIPDDNGDGTVSIVTPAHEAGVVDVEVSWTLNGIEQSPIVYPGAFEFYAQSAPTITDPSDQTVLEGEPANFTVTATGEPTPTVTWESSTDDGVSWVPVTAGVSEDGLTLSLGSVSLANNGTEYRAIATNSEGAATSAPATLVVSRAPVAPTIAGPVDQAVTAGQSATFSVTTTGEPTPTVTWESSTDNGVTWVPVTDGVSGDGLTLSLAAVTLADSGTQYRATATNSEGSVISLPATLTVTAADGNGGGDPEDKEDEVTKELAVTGLATSPLFWVAAVTAVVLGGGLIAGNQIIRRRITT